MLFLVGFVVVLKARAYLWARDWAGDDFKVSVLFMLSALPPWQRQRHRYQLVPGLYEQQR